MKQTDAPAKVKEKVTFSKLMENNKVVFAFSLLLAIVFWCGVSMFQTTETDKVIQNVKVQLNLTDSVPQSNGLQLFGESDFYVDVTVNGKSYLVNDADLANNITVSASLASVVSAGTYNLPLTYSIKGSGVSITNLSKANITVYFDKLVSKEFELTEEVTELEGFAVAEGFEMENPRLSVEKVTLSGPSLEINRIASVKAVASLSKELTSTEAFEAKIIPVGSSADMTFENITVANEEPIYITVPITYTSVYTPAVSFTNIPKSYRDSGIEYSVYPSTAKVTVATSDVQLINSNEIQIGSIDFSDINNEVNYIKLSTADLPYTFVDGITEFTVTIDMSSMQKRWLEIPVELTDIELPDNAELVNSTIASVQIVGPEKSVANIDASAAYAVPLLEGIELTKGVNVVPVKIILRTLTDSWVRGEYSVQINVK